MLSLSFSALSFTGPLVSPASSGGSHVQMQIERSAAIPFLKKPPALDGTLAGDVGFDPLGFTTTITELGGDLNYVREAELMHGRVSMLAVVGFVWPSIFGKLNVEWAASVSTEPLTAQYQLPGVVLGQLALSMAIAEGIRSTIIYKEDSVPGEHGFDPAGFIPKFCNTPEKMAAMKFKEITHCRTAMIAITGFFFQEIITGHVWPLI